MSDNKEKQALFMEARNELKEYAKVNGNIVTRDDVTGSPPPLHLATPT